METGGVMHSNKCQTRLTGSQGVKSHCLRIQLQEGDSKSRLTEFPVMAKGALTSSPGHKKKTSGSNPFYLTPP